jgi:hypothetical protein
MKLDVSGIEAAHRVAKHQQTDGKPPHFFASAVIESTASDGGLP